MAPSLLTCFVAATFFIFNKMAPKHIKIAEKTEIKSSALRQSNEKHIASTERAAPLAYSQPRNLPEFVSSTTIRYGIPVIKFHNICLEKDQMVLMVESDAEKSRLESEYADCCALSGSKPPAIWDWHPKCFGDERLSKYSCASSPFGVHKMELNFGLASSVAPGQWVEGDPLLMELAVTNMYQYGHSISRFVQTAVLDESSNVSHIVINRHHRLPGGPGEENLEFIYEMTIGQMPQPVLVTGGQRMCARSLLYIPHYERPFWHAEQAEAWRQMVTSRLGYTFPTCPPRPRACLLKRKGNEGSAKRGFSNEALIDAIAAEFGIPYLERVTVGAGNTTAETAALFASCSFLISTHSSQLKSLFFALPNTAVVEVTGTFIPVWATSAFAWGIPELGIHYVTSKMHGTNVTECGQPCAQIDKNSRVTVNESILRADMGRVMQVQREACPRIEYPPVHASMF